MMTLMMIVDQTNRNFIGFALFLSLFQYYFSGIVYDFDVMLQKKKEQNSRKRRRKNVDIINDSDDIIAEMIYNMKEAAEKDFELNKIQKTAVHKLKMLPLVEAQLKKIDYRDSLLDSGVLNVITDWLTRLPNGSLPHLQIREALLKVLIDVGNYHINFAYKYVCFRSSTLRMLILSNPVELAKLSCICSSIPKKLEKTKNWLANWFPVGRDLYLTTIPVLN